MLIGEMQTLGLSGQGQPISTTLYRVVTAEEHWALLTRAVPLNHANTFVYVHRDADFQQLLDEAGALPGSMERPDTQEGIEERAMVTAALMDPQRELIGRQGE